MKKTLFTALMMLAVLGFSGCQIPLQTAKNNIQNMKNIRVGMTKLQVQQIMGEPVSGETYCQPDVWFYYTEVVWADGLTTQDECTPLVFKDGKLIGIGRIFYTEYRSRGVRDLLTHPEEEENPGQTENTDTPAEAESQTEEPDSETVTPESASVETQAE